MEVNEPAPKYFPRMSPSAFLEWEREQECKHEYVDGEVLAMSGASINHNKIVTNIVGNLWPYLKDKSCDIFASDLRVSVKWKDSFFYPDATIICDEPEFDDEKIKDTIKNPTVIFEILSASTENYDMGKKMMFYMQIESLQQYINIDSKSLYVRVMTRRAEERTWKFDEFIHVNDKVFIEPINFEISLTDLYKGIKF
ncbi:Uma2 family endonuclease [Parafilimonas sp.]|uniref:Uma2 family endonuclease n=1 Tax=Parafilimonas sp. TaxID=1969739 RepID=UPI0039E242CD